MIAIKFVVVNRFRVDDLHLEARLHVIYVYSKGTGMGKDKGPMFSNQVGS